MSAIKKILQNKTNLSRELNQQLTSSNLSWIEQYNSQIPIDNSMKQWPSFPELKKQINIPLCLSITPFQDDKFQQIGFIQNLNSIRCFSCKAFVSKLCCITNEKSYDCSICGSTNTFQTPIDMNSDVWNKMGYQVEVGDALKQSTAPTLTLVIDVSSRAGKQGYLHHLTYSIKQYIKQIQNKNFFKILIITYDKYPHYYDLIGQDIKKIIVTDEYDVNQIQTLKSVEQKIDLILDYLQQTALNNCVNSSLGMIKALQMAIKITQKQSGSIFVFSSLNEPIKSPKIEDTKQKKLQINKQLERKFIIEMKNANNSISFFMFPSSYINLQYFYGLTKLTNGHLFHYPQQDCLNFYYDLNTLLYTEQRYQVISKVRNTPGIKLSSVFGSYLASNVNDQILLFTCPSTKSYIFEFNIQAKMNSIYSVVQFAFLFSTKEGKRKFRVMNHIIINQQNGIKCLNSIDYSVVNLYYIKASSQTLDSGIEQKTIRTVVQQRFSKHMRYRRSYFLNKQQNQKDVSLYVTMTYGLLRSPVLNKQFIQSIEYDTLTQNRSFNLYLGFNQLALIIFPIPYGITALGQQIIELTTQSTNKYSIVVIDRFVELLVYFNLRMSRLRQIFGEKIIVQKVNQQKLSQLQGQQIRVLKNKTSSYQRIRFVSNVDKYLLFSVQGNFGYQNFIQNIIK